MKNKIILALLVIMGSVNQLMYSGSAQTSLEEIVKAVDEYINNDKNKIGQEHKLIQAILNNNLDDVKKAIESGANVNFQQDNKNPLFKIKTVRNEDTEKEKKLELGESDDQGSDEKLTDIENFIWYLKEGITPLEIVIVYVRNADLIKYLLENGANPNLSDNNGFTPLMLAAIYNDNDTTEIADLLIQKGATINTRNYLDDPGYTALYYAAYNSHPKYKLMNFLLKNGAHINMKYLDGDTLLHFAIDLFDVEISQNNIYFLRWLLEHKADPNISNDTNMTPLTKEMSLIQNNDDPTVINILLKYGANPNVFMGNTTKTVLMEAIDKKCVNIIESLLESGAKPQLLPQDYRIKLQDLRFPKYKKNVE